MQKSCKFTISERKASIESTADPLSIQLIGLINKVNPRQAFILGSFLILCIGALSFVVNPLFSSSLLYLIPILMITHRTGFRAGFVAATTAALIWFTADLCVDYKSSNKIYENSFIPYWNVFMRWGSFLVALTLVSAVGFLNRDLESRVEQRTAELEKKIREKNELEKTILEISDREQIRIGQDLHDGLSQQLVSAAFSANLLKEKLLEQQRKEKKDAEFIAKMIDDAITEARNLARGLFPTRLENEGLETALQELVGNMRLRFQASFKLEYLLPEIPCKRSVAIHIYRIAQEALMNAAKHANPKHVVISLSSAAGLVSMTIQDDGIGIINFPFNSTAMGLRIMEYRSRLIGGSFSIRNIPYQGTIIMCQIEEKSFFESIDVSKVSHTC